MPFTATTVNGLARFFRIVSKPSLLNKKLPLVADERRQKGSNLRENH